MEIIQIIVGRYLVEFVGASVRFIAQRIISKLTGKNGVPFRHYWQQKKGGAYENMETETANRIAGIFILFTVFGLLLFFTV